MSAEQNKTVVRRFVEQVLPNMDTSAVDEVFDPGYVNHVFPGGPEGMKQLFSMVRSAYPNLKWNFKIERLMAEGDYVMMRATMHITNNGKEATGSGLGEYRLANGKIVEDWPVSSAAELMQQVGVVLPG
ncbi:MAG TPA: ester cyclase [Anaerolineales bacterium]|jgi:predicted SnoaL-like aldol condensation-catalyzing enzyme